MRQDSQRALKEVYIMVNIDNISDDMAKQLAFSDDEINEIKKARQMEITFDEDCPEVTPEKALKFQRVNSRRTNTKTA